MYQFVTDPFGSGWSPAEARDGSGRGGLRPGGHRGGARKGPERLESPGPELKRETQAEALFTRRFFEETGGYRPEKRLHDMNCALFKLTPEEKRLVERGRV